MGIDGEVTLSVHGLAVDNGFVRADTFLEKFRIILNSLKTADKEANEKKAHEYVIIGLEAASAHATLREKIAIRKIVPASSVHVVQEVIEAVYNGDRNISRFPEAVVRALAPLSRGVGKSFSHGEVTFSKNNVVRIDDYFQTQMEKAVKRLEGYEQDKQRFFEGVAFETLDGIVKEIDARGTLVRGKLILTIGGKELDCVFHTSDVQVLRDSFDKRARVEGIAHYDGESLLPVRLDVRRVVLVDTSGDLRKWRGKLQKTKRSGGMTDG